MSDALDADKENLISALDVERHCWICFATDEDDAQAVWARPCKCKGTSKWVHQICLLRWVDEKQNGNPANQVACPQCNATYIIAYPDMGPLVVIMDSINSVIYKLCPFVAAGLMVGSFYWVAVTYGAVTVMQIMGPDEGQELLEASDPLFLLVTLPTIPTSLILGHMIQWEDSFLSFMRRQIDSFPSFSSSSSDRSDERPTPPPPPPPSYVSDPVSATHVLCSALVFPTMATIVGNVFFRSVRPQIQRTALGAIAFLVCKGVFNLYHKQQIHTRQRQRRIVWHP